MNHPPSAMEVDDEAASSEMAPARASTSSTSSAGGDIASSSHGGRPTSAPVINRGSGVPRPTPRRALRTAPAPTLKTVGSDQNVRVVARVRPLSAKELGENSSELIVAQARSGAIRVHHAAEDGDGGDERRFEFDAVFGPASTQEEVYARSCGDMIAGSLFKGFNATILAYGQTGSGKTHTMGTDGSDAGGAADGVIARAVADLFRARGALPHGAERVRVTMSYLEIYNERAIDLLNDDPAAASAPLQVRDSKTEGVIIPGLKHFVVASPGEIRALMARASVRRATGSTNMNSVSSRSHAICTLNVTIGPAVDGAATAVAGEDGGDSTISPRAASQELRAKLTLVDLGKQTRFSLTLHSPVTGRSPILVSDISFRAHLCQPGANASNAPVPRVPA